MREIPIRKLQLMKLEVLKLIDDICKKEDITYFLAYGTLIGAIREKGFVPWDQDIDLIMIRDQYEKFNKVAPKYLDTEKYFLQNYDTEKEMVPPITRICIKGTYRASAALEHLNYEKGSFVDIFPLDYSVDTASEEQYKSCRKKFSRILFIKSKPQSRSLVKRAVKNVLRAFASIIPVAARKRSLVAEMKKHSTGNVLVDFAGEYGIMRESFDPSWFSEAVYMDFGDGQFPCPVGYDAILTKIYGNYMQRPPEDKRKPDLPSYYLGE